MRKGIRIVACLALIFLAIRAETVLADNGAEERNTGRFCYWGDVNGDSDVNLLDVNVILKGALGIEKIEKQYDPFFVAGIPQLTDANEALKTALGITPMRAAVAGEYVELDIEREYICKDIIVENDLEDLFPTGAYAVTNKQEKEQLLALLAKHFGVDSTVYTELKEYFDEQFSSELEAEKRDSVPVLLIADLIHYFDLGVNSVGNGFGSICMEGTEECTYDFACIYGCFTARQDVRCSLWNCREIEFEFAETDSEKEMITGGINENIYVSVVSLPRWVVEKALLGVSRQRGIAGTVNVLSEEEMLSIYENVLNALQLRKPMEFLALHEKSLYYTPQGGEEKIKAYLEELYGIDVYICDSIDELVELGLVVEGEDGTRSMNGWFVDFRYFEATKKGIDIYVHKVQEPDVEVRCDCELTKNGDSWEVSYLEEYN